MADAIVTDTGCSRAVAIRDRLRADTRECELAYGLERQFGRVCRRRGGTAICGRCAGDLGPEEAARVSPAAIEGGEDGR